MLNGLAAKQLCAKNRNHKFDQNATMQLPREFSAILLFLYVQNVIFLLNNTRYENLCAYNFEELK